MGANTDQLSVHQFLDDRIGDEVRRIVIFRPGQGFLAEPVECPAQLFRQRLARFLSAQSLGTAFRRRAVDITHNEVPRCTHSVPFAPVCAKTR